MKAALLALALAACGSAIPGRLEAQDPAGANGTAAVEVAASSLKGLRGDVAALLLAGREGGAFPLYAAAEPLAGSAGEHAAALFLDLDGDALLGLGPAESLSLEVYAYAISAAGGVASFLSQTFELATERFGEVVAAGGIKFVGHLDGLAAGRYALRILVRETSSQRFALRELPLSVPGAEGVGLAPVFGDRPGAGVWVRQAADGAGPGPAFAAFVARAQAAVPAVQPGFERQAPARAPQPALAEPEGGRRAEKELLAEIEADYRAVLGLQATGAAADALAALDRLESQASAIELRSKDDPKVLLEGAQLAVVQALAERRRDSLVPILALHLEAHDRYVGTRRFPLARHSRRVIAAVARLYAADAGNDLAPVLAADAFADLGTYLMAARLREEARDLLEAALAFDDRNPCALLQLGVYHERHGEYRAAVEVLERLTDAAPDAREGRLRLAVNLRRVERAADAVRHLRQLLQGRLDDWVAVVAFEELADLYLRDGRTGTAVGLLEQGIGRFPERSRLRIQLAYALDRLGEPKRTAAVLARLDPRPATAGRSPRFLYNRLSSDDDRASLRGTLLRESNARLASLSAALGN